MWTQGLSHLSLCPSSNQAWHRTAGCPALCRCCQVVLGTWCMWKWPAWFCCSGRNPGRSRLGAAVVSHSPQNHLPGEEPRSFLPGCVGWMGGGGPNAGLQRRSMGEGQGEPEQGDRGQAVCGPLAGRGPRALLRSIVPWRVCMALVSMPLLGAPCA